MSINSGMQSAANRLHARAVKEGSLEVGGQRYSLNFVDGVYEVTDSSGNHVVTFNTRKITEAKKWLAEYLG